MNGYKHPLDRTLSDLLSDKVWEKDDGIERVEAYLYDYFAGLKFDLREEGLPDRMCSGAMMKAVFDVCAVDHGRLETSKLIAAQMNRLVNEDDLKP